MAAVLLCPGAVPLFVRLLSSEHMNVVDQAVWALGNIAGNGADCRDFTVRCGIIQPLIALIRPSTGVREGGVGEGRSAWIEFHSSFLYLSLSFFSFRRSSISVMSLGLCPTSAGTRTHHHPLRLFSR